MATTADTTTGPREAALSRAAKHAHQAEEHLASSRRITVTTPDKDRLVAVAGVHASLALYYHGKAAELQAA